MKTIDPPARSFCIQVIAALGRGLVACLLCLSTNAFADPAPVEVGAFTRSDGVVVKAMEWESHSFLTSAGTNCWFELSDGTRISVPEETGKKAVSPISWERSCVVLVSDSVAEVYGFKSDARPVASRVLRFDGYMFSDVTTPGKRWLSPLIHTWGHIGDYLVPFTFFSVLVLLHWVGKSIIKPKPRQGWWGALRAAWFFCYVLLIFVFVFLLLLAAIGWARPISPIVALFFVAIWLITFLLVRRVVSALTNATSQRKAG